MTGRLRALVAVAVLTAVFLVVVVMVTGRSAGLAPPLTTLPPVTLPATVPSVDPLARLRIDDHPHATSGYRREDWPHWLDVDHDGCDTRDEMLAVSSDLTPEGTHSGILDGVATPRCHVTGGHWTSAYDGLTFTDPSRLDVDHVIPLAEAYRSGGWAWTIEQRAGLANDPANLWVVSAASNRSKGDSPPNEWMPPAHEVWCTYATRYVTVKVTYHLTATSPERDALGKMLETC